MTDQKTHEVDEFINKCYNDEKSYINTIKYFLLNLNAKYIPRSYVDMYKDTINDFNNGSYNPGIPTDSMMGNLLVKLYILYVINSVEDNKNITNEECKEQIWNILYRDDNLLIRSIKEYYNSNNITIRNFIHDKTYIPLVKLDIHLNKLQIDYDNIINIDNDSLMIPYKDLKNIRNKFITSCILWIIGFVLSMIYTISYYDDIKIITKISGCLLLIFSLFSIINTYLRDILQDKYKQNGNYILPCNWCPGPMHLYLYIFGLPSKYTDYEFDKE